MSEEFFGLTCKRCGQLIVVQHHFPGEFFPSHTYIAKGDAAFRRVLVSSWKRRQRLIEEGWMTGRGPRGRSGNRRDHFLLQKVYDVPKFVYCGNEDCHVRSAPCRYRFDKFKKREVEE
jgi:hypothetical protein